MKEKRGDNRFINYNRITLELAARGAIAGAGTGAKEEARAVPVAGEQAAQRGKCHRYCKHACEIFCS